MSSLFNSRPTLLALSFILAVLVVAFLAWQRAEGTRRADQQFATIVRDSVVRRTVLAGTVTTDQRTLLSASAPGRIDKTPIQRGALVKAGQIVVLMDSEPARRDVLRRRVALLRARAALEKVTAEGGSPKDVLEREAAAAEVEASGADLALAERTWRETRLVSPIDGVLAALLVQPGDFVMSTQNPLAIVVDPKTLCVEAEGDEFETSGLRMGAPAVMYLEASNVSPLSGALKEVPVLRRTRGGQATAAVFGVKACAHSQSPMVDYYGTTARLEVEAARRSDVPVIPLRALVKMGDVDYVVVRERGDLIARQVSLGLVGEGTAELLSGVDVGSEVLVADTGTLRETLSVLRGQTAAAQRLQQSPRDAARK